MGADWLYLIVIPPGPGKVGGTILLQAACPPYPHVLLSHKETLGIGAGHVTTVCSQCDKPERQCTCEKYCCFCQSQHNVRLCADGLYYCPDCREACDVQLADTNGH